MSSVQICNAVRPPSLHTIVCGCTHARVQSAEPACTLPLQVLCLHAKIHADRRTGAFDSSERLVQASDKQNYAQFKHDVVTLSAI
jgi:hypothetical protein